jgi:alpha-L-fucosidase
MTDTSWFENDRFGMFIHWGLYAIPGGVWKGKKVRKSYSEWLQASEAVPRETYRHLASEFNPTRFDARTWIRYAADAGMRYFLITAKHHDGFCLWPTRVSKYNVVDATPFKRDILGELAEACRAEGLKLGFYYSHWMDWDGSGGDVWYGEDVPHSPTMPAGSVSTENEYRHPTQAEFECYSSYWQGKCLPQVRELIENYDPGFLWFDSWGDFVSEYINEKRQDELIDHIRQHSDHCLVNSRINFKEPTGRCDYLSMMDNCFPNKTFDKPWETSGTLNHSWGYHQLDFGWTSTEQLIRYLVGNASLGGNYQLNVGPTPDGCFQPAAIRRLREIGCWLKVNGESVYGTCASPLGKMPFGKITYRADSTSHTYYLHLWEYSPGTAVHVEGLHGSVREAMVLESGQSVLTQTSKQGTFFSLPSELKGLQLPVIKVLVQK